jgi:hypothetical protein
MFEIQFLNSRMLFNEDPKKDLGPPIFDSTEHHQAYDKIGEVPFKQTPSSLPTI